MICPVCVHKDPDSAYGVTIPDFPGCFSTADQLEARPLSVDTGGNIGVRRQQSIWTAPVPLKGNGP